MDDKEGRTILSVYPCLQFAHMTDPSKGPGFRRTSLWLNWHQLITCQSKRMKWTRVTCREVGRTCTGWSTNFVFLLSVSPMLPVACCVSLHDSSEKTTCPPLPKLASFPTSGARGRKDSRRNMFSCHIKRHRQTHK